MGTEEDKPPPFGEWLRREMQRRGYDTEGPRAGGRTRLAAETGISLSVISRILIDNRVPEIKALRAIGQRFGYSLGEMLVHAGLAEPDEFGVHVRVSPTENASSPHTGVDIPPEVDLDVLPEWERHVWLTPGLTIEERRMMILLVRLARDELHDVPALIDLKDTVDEIIKRELRGGNPGHASNSH